MANSDQNTVSTTLSPSAKQSPTEVGAMLARELTSVMNRLANANRIAASGQPLQALDMVDSIVESLTNISRARRGR
jgi:high-affinity K+ transport system ATPase subunit B